MRSPDAPPALPEVIQQTEVNKEAIVTKMAAMFVISLSRSPSLFTLEVPSLTFGSRAHSGA